VGHTIEPAASGLGASQGYPLELHHAINAKINAALCWSSESDVKNQ
jgi:hypothetical protein